MFAEARDNHRRALHTVGQHNEGTARRWQRTDAELQRMLNYRINNKSALTIKCCAAEGLKATSSSGYNQQSTNHCVNVHAVLCQEFLMW